jgi:hypothetical protein
MFVKQAENASSPLRQQVTNNTTTTTVPIWSLQNRAPSIQHYRFSNTGKRLIFQTDHYVLNEAARFVCANQNDVVIYPKRRNLHELTNEIANAVPREEVH